MTAQCGFAQVFYDELNALGKHRAAGAHIRPEPEEDSEEDVARLAGQAELTGLAFSGGGIRSATFNLGMLQALAKLQLLDRFDYLSTVSGGGYIGSWFSALLRRSRIDPAQDDGREAVAALSRCLESPSLVEPLSKRSKASPAPAWAAPAEGRARQFPPLEFLRQYSNYLTPRLGMIGADTLTAVAVWLRNFYLLQAVLIGTLTAALLLPYFAIFGASQFDRVSLPETGLVSTSFAWLGLPTRAAPLLIAAMVLLTVSSMVIGKNLVYGLARWGRGGMIALMGVTPVLLASFCLSYYFRAIDPQTYPDFPAWRGWVWAGALLLPLYFLPWLVFTARQWAGRRRRRRATVGDGEPRRMRLDKGVLRVMRMALATIAAGAFGGLLFNALYRLVHADFLSGSDGYWLVGGFGTLIALKFFSLAITLLLGLAGRDMSEAAREWWVRLGAWTLTAGLVWAGAFVIFIYGPPLLVYGAWKTKALLGAWLASTAGGIALAKSALSGGAADRQWVRRLVTLLPYVFIVGLLFVITYAIDAFIHYRTAGTALFENDGSGFLTLVAQMLPALEIPPPAAAALVPELRYSAPGTALVLLTGCLVVVTVLALRLDINLFSLHHFYRMRLTRCYLGASRHPHRTPNPFTGFDPADDMRLSDLADGGEDDPRRCQRPYHLFSTALNLTGGSSSLAWQQRKAASFLFSPKYCGFWLPRSDADGGAWTRGAFVRTTVEGKGGYIEPEGPCVGTAMAISGAAASPNMGYHSSPVLAFLLTFFAVRLGRWCGNPCYSWAAARNGPYASGWWYLLSELFGRAGRSNAFVYLSDGGHFENLGIYELVRRRCKLIVASDASADPAYSFEGVANAIRKCYTDFGVVIDVNTDDIRPKTDSSLSASHYAIGSIRYPDAPPGTLIYIKASVTAPAAVALAEYRSGHPLFPHETTNDQWFDEAQFESYRALGEAVGLAVMGATVAPNAPADRGLAATPEST